MGDHRSETIAITSSNASIVYQRDTGAQSRINLWEASMILFRPVGRPAEFFLPQRRVDVPAQLAGRRVEGADTRGRIHRTRFRSGSPHRSVPR